MTTAYAQIRLPAAAAAVAPRSAVVAAPAQTITALPNIVNLHIYQGDDFYLDVTVANPDGTDTDLTGADPMAQIRATPEAEDVRAEFAITVDPDIGGLLHLHLSSDDSTNLPLSSVWDLQLNLGDINTIIAGKITTVREVTR